MANGEAPFVLPRRLLGRKHRKALGLAIYLLAMLASLPRNRAGFVMDGKPVRRKLLAAKLEMPLGTFERHLEILRVGGYIETTKTAFGLRIKLRPVALADGDPKSAANVAAEMRERVPQKCGEQIKERADEPQSALKARVRRLESDRSGSRSWH